MKVNFILKKMERLFKCFHKKEILSDLKMFEQSLVTDGVDESEEV